MALIIVYISGKKEFFFLNVNSHEDNSEMVH